MSTPTVVGKTPLSAIPEENKSYVRLGIGVTSNLFSYTHNLFAQGMITIYSGEIAAFDVEIDGNPPKIVKQSIENIKDRPPFTIVGAGVTFANNPAAFQEDRVRRVIGTIQTPSPTSVLENAMIDALVCTVASTVKNLCPFLIPQKSSLVLLSGFNRIDCTDKFLRPAPPALDHLLIPGEKLV